MKSSNSLMEKTKKLKKVISSTLIEKTTSLNSPMIDYPREGEQVLQGSYTIRVSAQPEMEVQIAINNEGWTTCRWAVGHYWLDWEPTTPGSTKIACRARTGKGRWKTAETKTVEVV